MSVLRAQFAALPSACSKVVVDNASTLDLFRLVETLVGKTPNATLLRNAHNDGLGAAINAGVKFVNSAWPDIRFVLLLDQDSEPMLGSVVGLVEAFDVLRAQGEPVGCVGPTLIDANTGLQHGFHQCTRWRWKRVYPARGSTAVVKCANLNGSGTLVPIDLFLKLGGLDGALFIDHVDTEWSFRVMDAGYSLWGIPDAVFLHSMGESSRRFWCFGWRVWPSRSPQRHYFLFRNAIILMRRDYVPMVWKVWAIAKLSLTVVIIILMGPARLTQLRNML
jgi:rhamnosyltransferase